MVLPADAALLEAKRQGRDRVVIAEHIVDELADQEIVARLGSATAELTLTIGRS